jgi:SAM-dependent methyltransferase
MNNEDKAQFWEDIYLNQDTGWDLEGVTPVFEYIAEDIKPGNLCIIGCGRGYDAVMFSKKGFNVTAVDFAPSAINALNQLAAEELVNINTLQKDIFSLTPDYLGSFNYIIEQTCFCAIHPTRREEYQTLVRSLLIPGGKLIGLWFPLDKKLDKGGPPYGTNVDEVKSIFDIGWKIKKEEFPEQSIKPRKGREKLIIFEKC